MFLPQDIEGRDNYVCPPGQTCAPIMAIVGTDPLEKENDGKPSGGPNDFEKPGPHRYIGIGMVAGMVFIVLVLYLMLGKRPRRFAKAHIHLKVGKEEPKEDVVVVEVKIENKPEEESYRPKRQKKTRRQPSQDLGGRARLPEMKRYKSGGVELEYVVDWEYRHTHDGFFEVNGIW
jgi:hypothetical protein